MANDFFFVFFSLLKSCIGAGILTYPMLFATYGIIPTILYTLLSSFASFAGCSLFVDLNASRKKNCTMDDVAYNTPSWLKYFVSFVVIGKCYITTMIYAFILRSLVSGLNLHLIGEWIDFRVTFSAVWILVTFLSFNKNIRSFKGLSSVGLLGVVVLYCGAYYMSLKGKLSVPTTTGRYNFLDNLSFWAFSFNCHHSIFGVHNACSDIPAARMKKYLICVFASASIIYLAFGYINCTFIAAPSRIVLDSWPKGTAYYWVLFCYSIIIVSSIILQLYPIGEQLSKLSRGQVNHTYGMIVVNASIFLLAILDFKTADESIKVLSSPFSTVMCFMLPPFFMCFEKKKLSSFQYAMGLFLVVYSLLCLIAFVNSLQ